MTAIEIVALTLLHFLWQGALLHLALVTILSVARPRTAHVRYLLSTIALGFMAIAPMATAVRLTTQGSADVTRLAPATSNAAAVNVAKETGVTDPISIAATPGGSAIATPADILAALPQLSQSLSWIMPWLVATWLAGVIALAIRLFGGWLRLRSVVRSGLLPESHEFDALMARLRERLRVMRPVRVLESSRVAVPAIVGWLRPVLLVPASLSSGLTVAQLETILAHELAHIRRHDYAVNLLQSVIETVLFYHPSIWWISKRIREEREHCCDDLAVDAVGDARLYASALLALETQRLGGTDLAMAATRGNLLYRVRRLLAPASVADAEGSRWFAGVFVLAAVLLVGGGARILRAEPEHDRSREAPNENSPLIAESQTGSASLAVDTVIVYRGSEPLESRVRWAHDAARGSRLDRYWIGYAVAGDIDRGWIYFNRHIPVRASGGTMISGRLRMKQPSGLQFSGTRLESLVPARPESDVAILLGFTVRNGRPVLDRVHAANFVFPVALDGRALVWLGESADAPSIALAQQLFANAGTKALREDVAGIVGVHTNSGLVRPVLTRWLAGEAADDFRAQVVEWLGDHADASTLGLLANTARGDRSSRVRMEAAETVGEVELPAALDTLIAMVETLTDRDARREAVEGFGQRSEPRALDALRRITERDESPAIQREAVETMGELETARSLEVITELAQSHRDADIRREAVETLGERAPMDDLLRILGRIIEEDRSVDVQREAVETLAERDGARVVELLAEIAERHPEEDVQREATESLGHASPVDMARRVLQRLAREHARTHVRREAIETLAEEMPGDSAAAFFGAIVRGDGARDIKITALEALAEMDDTAALTVVLDVARDYPDRAVRRKAIELLGESDDPRARAALERILLRP